MSDTGNPATLATAAPPIRRERFENAWRCWQVGDDPPRWEHFLPAMEEPCSSEFIAALLQIDIEFRVKAALPALLAERYFGHPRLQQSDARLDAGQQVQLIRWEYAQRWQNGQPARRGDYQAAFSQQADNLSDLKAYAHCPRCRQVIVLEETWQTLRCPHCESESPLGEGCPPFVSESSPSAETVLTLDSRRYQLIEKLGKGGMGEVYPSTDPALERDLAIKVMKSDLEGHAEYERRFLREARVTGSLQHPSIVAVHNLGRLADGRLHYTMRLVRGQTFADILKDEAGKRERLPSLLAIFEKICQAMAYTHSKRVIHRDLKPSNVMVGRFGEVQVMDWGLAKVLTSGDAADADETPDAAGTHIPTESADTPVDLSRMGSGFGTPAYMPPEQALGEWDAVDERADVFALGSLLCEMLTGQAAYSGDDGGEVYRRAKRGDVAETLERLERSRADAALTALCRECLSPHREGRPRDAGTIAKRMADYQTEVQERLRRAELERVAAEARAVEERRRRRIALALAGALLLLASLSGIGAWWYQRVEGARAERVARTERDVRQALSEGLAFAEQARGLSANPQEWEKTAELGLSATQRAQVLLESGEAAGGISRELSEQVRAVTEELTRQTLQAARIAADLDTQDRHNAACSAVLAAAGQGEDARLLPDKVRGMFRRWAFLWLREDLIANAKLAERNNPAANKVIQQRLTHWRSDPDLASVRDPKLIDRLANDERAAWQMLWRDVDDLAKRVSK